MEKNVKKFGGKFYRIQKIGEVMKKIVGISVIVGIVIVVGVIAYQFNESTWEVTPTEEYYEKDGKVSHVVYPDNPQFLGPLQINKDRYLLGENVFVILKDLIPTDKGMLLFFTPEGKLFYEFSFNGSNGDFKKFYFKPQLLKAKNICEVEQLVGTWSVVFAGYEQYKLNFQMEDAFLPNNEQFFIECADPLEISDDVIDEVEKIIEEQNKP